MIRKTIRRSALLLLVAVIVFSLNGCGSSKADFNNYNGIPFGATQREVMPKIEEMLKKLGYDGEVVEEVTYNKYIDLYIIEDNFNDVMLDGYETNIQVCFLNKEDKNITDAKFYEVTYYIHNSTQYKEEEVIEFYKKKFDKLYGEPQFDNVDDETGTQNLRWNDENNNAGCGIASFHHSGDYLVLISWYSNIIKNELQE